MSSPKKLSTLTSKSFEDSQELIQHSWEYYKLKLFLHVAEFSTNLVKYSLIGSLGLFLLLFLSIALALYIGEAMGNTAIGFVIAALIYGLFLMVIIIMRKKIEKIIVSKLSKSMLHDE
ncbi:hypothetical protein HME9304_00178 [Flagellimonas maritima]|uniref:Phage holin family protein n=1 Tax=Flagellimonas maritima TaxID=1383885 RepID=A0A2Z4LMY5_9FLAO|nr:hypothetical protein [Allomuricauda aurantiaca]AWX43191.1 hypothetical protein HME9304_00178 [Allomuricauda aurantiaca]